MLHKSGVNVCLTAGYNKQQALVAAGVGAKYFAPHLDKMNRAGRDGMAECKEIIKIMNGLDTDTRVILASIRNTECMSELAAHGLNTMAMPAFVAEKLFLEELTDARAQEFEDAAIRGYTEAMNVNGDATNVLNGMNANGKANGKRSPLRNIFLR